MLYTERDVERGQEVFLNNGLMEYGSVFGHGAYLGPDYTADYLRRAPTSCAAATAASARQRGTEDIEDFRTNRYDERTGELELTARRRRTGWSPTTRASSRSPRRSTGSAGRDHRPRRPRRADGLLRLDRLGGRGRAADRDYSYTNNWPPEPRVANEPTANVVVWSVLSLIALLVASDCCSERSAIGTSSAGTAASRPP